MTRRGAAPYEPWLTNVELGSNINSLLISAPKDSISPGQFNRTGSERPTAASTNHRRVDRWDQWFSFRLAVFVDKQWL